MGDQINRRRHVSADVASLDSWSEAISAEELTKSPEKKQRNESELVLSLNKLQTIEEPEEPKMARVKLLKSEAPEKKENSSRKSAPIFFKIPKETSDALSHKKQKKRHKYLHHSDVSSESGHIHDNGNVGFHQEMTDNPCTCTHCEKIQRQTGHHKSKSSHKSIFKQPRDAATGIHPFGQITINPNSTDFGHDVDQGDKVKNKIMSVLNNVKYGWTFKTKTNFVDDSPIFLLGRCYHKRPEDEEHEPGKIVQSLSCLESFKQDFQSRLWFTYRRDFQSLPNTRFTTDCGWGCMLRSGQMMLGEAFLTHFLGRDWRVHSQTQEQQTFYRQIIQWFGDSLSDQCPFSVHKLSELGKVFGKQPGEWYGPSSVAYILRDAVNKAYQSQPVLKDLCVYVAQDCTVYKQDIIQLCTTRPRNFTSTSSEESCPEDSTCSDVGGAKSDEEEEWKRSVIILIPVRLGGEEFNPIYSACIKNLMAQDSCLGLIGGKPKHSLYFIGWQEDKLIYLDPHFCQDYVDTLKRDFRIESYHCVTPKKISLSKMDPSATIGFYCKKRADFEKFVEQSEEIASPPKGGGVYPMFVFNEGRGSDIHISDLSISVERSLRIRHAVVDRQGRIRSPTLDSEEYVVL